MGFFFFFQIESCEVFARDWPWTAILQISVTWVASEPLVQGWHGVLTGQ
jgi:hypothetical protein